MSHSLRGVAFLLPHLVRGAAFEFAAAAEVASGRSAQAQLGPTVGGYIEPEEVAGRSYQRSEQAVAAPGGEEAREGREQQERHARGQARLYAYVGARVFR